MSTENAYRHGVDPGGSDIPKTQAETIAWLQAELRELQLRVDGPSIKSGVRSTAFILCLAATIKDLREVARSHGYALAVHGSMARDFDLVACPWIDDAAAPEVLVEAMRERCHGHIIKDEYNPSPRFKPHGRLAWKIHLDTGTRGPYIDLSVMPRGINL